MGLLSQIEKRAAKGWLTNLRDPARWLLDALYGGSTAAGVTVNERTALQNSTIWACVNSISQDMSAQPCPAYQRLEDDSREVLRSHPAHQRLNRRANPEISGMVFRQTLTGHVLTWGNGFAEIQRNGAGEAEALWPVEPDRVNVERKGGKLRYWVRPMDRSQKDVELAPEDVFHIRGLSWNGLVGYSPIRQHMETIGWATAQRQASARFFGQGSRPAGMLVTEKPLTPEQVDDLAKRWNEAYGGTENFGKTAVLHSNLKFERMTIPPDEAQFVETQKLTRAVIAGEIYRLPLHLIGEMDKAATYASVEQFFLAYVRHCLLPWARTWETEAFLKLTTEEEQAQERVYLEHNFDALLRGDTQTRSQAYKTFIEASVMAPNEVRRKENLKKLPGLDKPRGASNIGPIADDGTVSGPTQADGGGSAGSQAAAASAAQGAGVMQLNGDMPGARVYRQQVERIVRKEITAVRKAMARFGADSAGFHSWVDEFYGDLEREAAPVISAGHFRAARGALKEVTNREGLLAEWEKTRVTDILQFEAGEMGAQ